MCCWLVDCFEGWWDGWVGDLAEMDRLWILSGEMDRLVMIFNWPLR